MLGVDDFLVILAATTVANLVVEVGAEIIAEWWVHTPGVDPEIDPSAASEPINHAPELLTQISARADQTAAWPERTADSLGAQVGEHLSTKFDQTAAWWSERTADGLGAQVGERLATKLDEAAALSGQVVEKLSGKADALSVKAAETALWSEQALGALTASLGLQ
jgi:hypothetical protein